MKITKSRLKQIIKEVFGYCALTIITLAPVKKEVEIKIDCTQKCIEAKK